MSDSFCGTPNTVLLVLQQWTVLPVVFFPHTSSHGPISDPVESPIPIILTCTPVLDNVACSCFPMYFFPWTNLWSCGIPNIYTTYLYSSIGQCRLKFPSHTSAHRVGETVDFPSDFLWSTGYGHIIVKIVGIYL